MKKTVPLQRLITLRGTIPATTGAGNNVVQPMPGWADAKDATDAAIDVRVIQAGATVLANLVFLIETAASVTGPWTPLVSINSWATFPVNLVQPASTGYGAVAQLQRFLRWQIVVQNLAETDTWRICFRACVTLK